MRRLLFSNLTFACHHAPPCHWGKADPLHISVRRRDPAITPGIVEQVQFELYLLYDAGRNGRIAPAHRNMQRIGFSPVTGRRMVTGKSQITEQQTPHRATVTRQNADATVGIKNGAAGGAPPPLRQAS